MPHLRKVLFYIFAALYLILCPLLIIHMLGFVVNPQTLRFVKTGLAYVSTNPPGATVYVDGRQVRQRTPVAVGELTPGQHFIRIELSGYNDWEDSIPIVGKKATVLANTLLIPEKWPIKTVSDQDYQNILLAGQDILIATTPELKDLGEFRTTETVADNPIPRKILIFSKNSVYASGTLVHLYSSPPSFFILLEAMIKDKRKFLWINLQENPPLIEDISDLFPEIPLRVIWQDSDNENIMAFYSNSVDRINVAGKAIYPQIRLPWEQNRGPALDIGNNFLINDKNDLLLKEGEKIRLYPQENFGTPKVFEIAQSKPSTNMYFEDKDGELFFLDDRTGALCAVQILPFHPILNIPIPDALRNKISNNES